MKARHVKPGMSINSVPIIDQYYSDMDSQRYEPDTHTDQTVRQVEKIDTMVLITTDHAEYWLDENDEVRQ